MTDKNLKFQHPLKPNKYEYGDLKNPHLLAACEQLELAIDHLKQGYAGMCQDAMMTAIHYIYLFHAEKGRIRNTEDVIQRVIKQCTKQ